MQNPPLHLPRLCRAPLARGTKSCLPSPRLTLAMPTELAFSSVMPWLVLSPRSHIPKSCREAAVRGVPQKPSNPTRWQCSCGVLLTTIPPRAPSPSHTKSPWATHRRLVGCFDVEDKVLDEVDLIQAVNYVEA